MRLIEESRRHVTRLSTLQRLYYEAQKRAVTDGLTGLYTHAYFREQLELHIFEAHRFNEDLGLMLIDIDFFKKFNDTYGHQIGDKVLREVARIIKDTVRGCDVVARYGGEEIIVILPKTDIEGVYVLAERIRVAMGEISIRDMANRPITPVTVSVGLAEWQTNETGSELVERADQALYEAKRTGRNRVVQRCA
jgi:diguanylate cyclase (GGDEF)-like protein